MNIVAIETATTACAIGLLSAQGCDVRVLDTQRRHTEVLTAGIAQLLGDHSLSASDLDRVVVDRGPGLFTGLRVGIATAQALAQGVGAELVAASSLELLARAAARDDVRGCVYALVDARRGEIFSQCFELNDDVDALEANDSPAVTTAPQLAQLLSITNRAVTLTGDGVARYRDVFAPLAHVTLREDLTPSPGEMLAIATWRPASTALAPLYLREADAVANFTTRQRAS